MARFDRLFFAPVDGGAPLARFVGKAFLLKFAWTTAFAIVYSTLRSLITHEPDMANAAIPALKAMEPWQLVGAMASLVLVEEVMRLAPLAIVTEFHRRWPNAWPRVVVLGAAVVMAVLFGLAHVANGLDWAFAIGAQGASGFIMNVVYLRAGALAGKPVRGFACAYTMHLAFDLLLIGMMKLGAT